MNAIVLSVIVAGAPAPPYRPSQKFTGTITQFWRVTDDKLNVSFRLCFAGRNDVYIFNNKSEAYSKENKVEMDPLHVAHLKHKKPIRVKIESYNRIIIKLTFEEGFP